MLDLTNLFKQLKSSGNVRNYNKYLNYLENKDLSEIKVKDLPILSKITGYSVPELLGLTSQVELESKAQIYAIQDHCAQIVGKVRRLGAESDETGNLRALADTLENGVHHVRLAYNPRKLKNISVRTHACNTPHTSHNIAARAHTYTPRGTPQNIVTCTHEHDGAGDTQNIATRKHEHLTSDENIATHATLQDENSVTRNAKHRENIAECMHEISPGVYVLHDLDVEQNITEANKLRDKEREVREQFKSAESVPKYWAPVVEHNLTYIPSVFAKNCVVFIDVKETLHTGTYTMYYSVFNKKGEFIFSEVYSCDFKESDNSEINYYRKIFNEPVQPDMEFEFSEEEKITEDEFYYGLYRQYRKFSFRN